MRRFVLSALILAAVGAQAAAQPFQDFFNYEAPRMPVAGSCDGAAWRGEFSGKRWDNFRDHYMPVAARGCFDSEIECRIWQQQAITYLDRGPLYYTSCRPLGY